MSKCYFAMGLLLLSLNLSAAPLTVEEKRIEKATQVMPKVTAVFDQQLALFKLEWQKSTNFQHTQRVVTTHAEDLWRDAKKHIHASGNFDDRPLFWARLKFSKMMRSVLPDYQITPNQLKNLLAQLELSSRGRTDLGFSQNTNKRILITGFDPFLLDRNINQSNPSGVAAMLLDGQVIEYQGVKAEINAVMVPVRYPDFDQGFVESLLAPYYALNSVDMVVTISMGRTEFDLEHFPGKRRSVTAPDNLNILSGGNSKAPVISMLNDRQLPGAEFVEFSLPYQAMQLAKGDYKINDNRRVVTLEKALTAESLEQLAGAIAVSGSGGGYLSNEISYRSIRLRNQLESDIPTGHIHTPRIAEFEPEIEAKIVAQIRAMLQRALSEI